MCHLSAEKLLKGLYAAALKKIPPKTHNLIHLLNATGVELPETIESLNALSIVTRYPEDIEAMVKAFKRKKAGDYLQKTKELLKWLKKDKRLRIS
ncbi:MAG: HEPN domain-containing protein [Nitrospirae bacterium]|nr:MAG: HEPN domain-containing protein [Nitrospirota bacterium]